MGGSTAATGERRSAVLEQRCRRSPSKNMNETFVNLVIRNYNSPMGVATYSTADDVPRDVRKALPDIDDLKALLEKGDA